MDYKVTNMKYDGDYGTFTFSQKDMEIILDALSFTHSHDTSLSQYDRDYIDGLYQSLDNSGSVKS